MIFLQSCYSVTVNIYVNDTGEFCSGVISLTQSVCL